MTHGAGEQLRPAVLRIQALGFWCTAEGERQRGRQEGMKEDAPRDESEVCKDFGQSFLWNVTESRAFWESDDDTGVFPTAPWAKIDTSN